MGTWGKTPMGWGGPWPRRSGALVASLCLHILALLLLQSEQLPRMDLVSPRDLLPVTIIEPKPKPVPPPAAPQAPPQPIPEPAEPAEPEPPPPPEERPKQAIPLPEQQIVSPSDAGEEIPPPPDTRLLSDRDNTVAEQMVRRGEPAQQEGEETTEPEAPAPAPAAKDQGDGGVNRQLAALPRLEQLLPNALELAGEGYGAAPGNQAPREEAKKEQPRRHFDNIWLPTSKDVGTLDFLPDVREGDITLLNTKAELFAPFVRRVAVRVFQNLLILLRRDLPGLAGTAEETVTMEAIMTRAGDLASLTIKERSSNLSIGSGRMLQQACRQGFFDRNPPAGAESDDGQIHFLLRTHILAIGDGGGVRYGYRVAFQAGLR